MGFQDTFCVLAFNHLQLAPNGTAKLCCIAGEDICDADGPLTLYRNTYEEIWNSPYMRRARQNMAEGKAFAACARCYREEKTLGVSRRTTQNQIWAEKGLVPRTLIPDAESSQCDTARLVCGCFRRHAMSEMWDKIPELSQLPYAPHLTHGTKNRPLYLRIETVNTCNNYCVICAYRD